MKPFILICLLFAACRTVRVCYDPEDVCQWTFRSTKDSVNIFVKKGNVLQWFHPSGVTEFYVQLDSYNPGKSYNYIAFYSNTGAHIFWERNRIMIFDYSYLNEKDFL